jgi:hypothetical protein
LPAALRDDPLEFDALVLRRLLISADPKIQGYFASSWRPPFARHLPPACGASRMAMLPALTATKFRPAFRIGEGLWIATAELHVLAAQNFNEFVNVFSRRACACAQDGVKLSQQVSLVVLASPISKKPFAHTDQP